MSSLVLLIQRSRKKLMLQSKHKQHSRRKSMDWETRTKPVGGTIQMPKRTMSRSSGGASHMPPPIWTTERGLRPERDRFKAWKTRRAAPRPSWLHKSLIRSHFSRRLMIRAIHSKYQTVPESLNHTWWATHGNLRFNMPIFGDDYDPNAKNPHALENDLRNEDIPGDRLTYLPAYAVEGYEEACDRWITGHAGAKTVWQLDLTKSTHSDWTQFGHTSNAAAASASVLFFFSASVGGSSDIKTLDFKGKDWRSDTKVTISMQGPPRAFTLRAGVW